MFYYMEDGVIRRILHIDLDAFFVSVEQALNPALKGKAVIVGGNPAQRGVVASASYEARKYGVHAAMPLKTAFRLCPHAFFLPGNFPRYREASEKFLNILADFSPDLEPLGLDEAYLDISGFVSQSATDIASQIKSRINTELSITATVGIASCKVVAKVATDLAKPDGLLEIPPGEEAAFLAPLAITRLPGVGKKAERILKSLGITTIQQLASLSPSSLRKILGSSGERLLRYAQGIDQSNVEPPAPAKSISREVTLSRDTWEKPLLQATLRYLSERVGAELRRQRKQARRITLKLRYADFETITRSYTLRQASDVDQIIFEVSVQLLDKALLYRREAVRLLGVEISALNGAGRQLSMLDSPQEKMARLDQVMDHLRRKYGFSTIQTGRTFSLREGVFIS
jgi:DNA polymerase-4